MKEILTNIQTALRGSSDLSYITDANIYIGDVGDLPIIADFPAIAINDGPVNFVIEEGVVWETTASVDVTILQIYKPGDVALMGQADPRIYGVLEIVDGVHATLFDNKLSIDEIEEALPVAETATEWVDLGDIQLLIKNITYQYRKLEENP